MIIEFNAFQRGSVRTASALTVFSMLGSLGCHDADLESDNQSSGSEMTTGTGEPGDSTGTTLTSDGDPSPYPALPIAANAFAATFLGNHVYVVGGHIGEPHDSSVDSLLSNQWKLRIDDPAGGWQAMENLSTPVQQATVTAYNGMLYRLGGLTSTHQADETSNIYTLSDFDRYDPITDTWTELPPMPDTRGSHSTALVNSTLIVSGGWKLEGPSESAQYHTTWQSIDLAQEELQWKTYEQPFQIRDHCSGTYNDKIFVLGGMLSGSFPLAAWVYDPAQPDLGWQEGPTIPTASPLGGFACASTTLGESLFFTAGEGTVFQLNPDEQTWSEVGQLEVPRIFHQLVALPPHRLMALGGGLGPNLVPTDSVEIITLP